MYLARFVPRPNEPIVVVDIRTPPRNDVFSGRRLRMHLSQSLGELPVVLCCRDGDRCSFDGDPDALRHALDPLLGSLPCVGIDLAPHMRKAA